MTDKHPDISDILKRKAEGRHSRAARSFAEKVARAFSDQYASYPAAAK
jgi:hypothetical protein